MSDLDNTERIAILRANRAALFADTRVDSLMGISSMLIGVMIGNAIGMLGGKFGMIDTGIFALSVVLLHFAVEAKMRVARKDVSQRAMELLDTIAPGGPSTVPPIPAGRVEHLN